MTDERPAPKTRDEIVAMSRNELLAYFDAGGDMSPILEGGTSNPPSGPRPRELPVIADEPT